MIVGLLGPVRMLEIWFACVDLEDDCTTAFALRCPRPRLGLVGAAFPSLKIFCLVVQLVRYLKVKVKVKRSQPSAAPTVFTMFRVIMMEMDFCPGLLLSRFELAVLTRIEDETHGLFVDWRYGLSANWH